MDDTFKASRKPRGAEFPQFNFPFTCSLSLQGSLRVSYRSWHRKSSGSEIIEENALRLFIRHFTCATELLHLLLVYLMIFTYQVRQLSTFTFKKNQTTHIYFSNFFLCLRMCACTFIRSSIAIKFSENSQRKNFEINGSELNMRRQRRNFREAMERIVAAMRF